ncbi:MAG TPA: NUDIX domain-containing protein [Segeticoccus sp.]|uniref:NUDIX hydrolase n=1 Tax=Segeticoccus sp. TaxID=2706531 RepID=UPI002D7F7018|nr:NUDIX domain-containing protein [Segeticoccus sp.]HET8600626.1 NUDIX domain-containing protein [Segeticoccus sp.]
MSRQQEPVRGLAPRAGAAARRDPRVVLAAGAVPWRRREGRLEVALVHRPRYDDWSWPKGKLDAGEDWSTAAVREVLEETGLQVRLGRPLPGASYQAARPNGWRSKQVRYWAGTVTGGDGRLLHEVDEVTWLDVVAATAALSYAHDREQLQALTRADREGGLDTWPVVLLRHAHARARERWRGPDRVRPLTGKGRRRAERLAPLLGAFGVQQVLTSPAQRCVDTVVPFSTSGGVETVPAGALGVEPAGDGTAPSAGVAEVLSTDCLSAVLANGRPTVLCTHGEVLPGLLELLADHADAEPAEVLRDAHGDAPKSAVAKGEAVIAHVSGTGASARVVAVERHQP